MLPYLRSLGLLTFPFALLSVYACSSSDSPSNGDRDAAPPAIDAGPDAHHESDAHPNDDAVCPNQRIEQTSAGPVIVCDDGYPTPPYLHVPAPRPLEGGNREVVGGIASATSFRDAQGNDYALPDGMARAETWDKASHEYQADHLYRATVDSAGKVTKLVRFAKAADALFFRNWEGRAFEGKIAKRVGDQYETTPSVPVRLRITEVREGLPPGWSAYENGVFVPLAPYNPVHTVAVVENIDHALTSANGPCLAPLSALGAEDPGIKATVRLVRVPSMHSPGANTVVVVLESSSKIPTNMAHTLWAGPADLISASGKVPGDFNAAPHGAPQYGIGLSMAPVTGGGAACTR
ncbi:hypothetical protein LZC95_01680 [Pendulispora brunnea]|uniref:Uncharacterized protein n=1 Tax=Pendulispora brunnea TaxID=2905690 RepID=A0ABZ2KA47_9BACT